MKQNSFRSWRWETLMKKSGEVHSNWTELNCLRIGMSKHYCAEKGIVQQSCCYVSTFCTPLCHVSDNPWQITLSEKIKHFKRRHEKLVIFPWHNWPKTTFALVFVLIDLTRNLTLSAIIIIVYIIFIGPESDHWECLSVTHWLTHSLLFSRLDWCDPGVWRCLLQTRGCYCSWC